MIHWLGNALRGLCMGAADVVPGVSGGTIALILGIYPRLVDAVGSVGPRMLLRLRERSFWRLAARGLRDPAELGGGPHGTGSAPRGGVEADGDADGAAGGVVEAGTDGTAGGGGEARADAARVLLLASLAIGIAPALLLGANVLPAMLDGHPGETMAFFLGLVLASVAVPLREMERIRPRHVVLTLAAATATVWFTGLPEPSGGRARGAVTLELAAPQAEDVRFTPRNLVLRLPGGADGPDIAYGPATTVTVPAGSTVVQAEVVARMAGQAANAPVGALEVESAPAPVRVAAQSVGLSGGRDPSLVYLFLGGMLAISAMALPGISGAFVLLLLGLYHFVLHSLTALITWRDLDALAVVATFAIALAVGLLTSVRVLKRLLERWRDATLAVLVGLMIGSLRKLWPFTDFTEDGAEALTWPAVGDPRTVSAGVAFACGVAAVVVLDAVGRRVRT